MYQRPKIQEPLIFKDEEDSEEDDSLMQKYFSLKEEEVQIDLSAFQKITEKKPAKEEMKFQEEEEKKEEKVLPRFYPETFPLYDSSGKF